MKYMTCRDCLNIVDKASDLLHGTYGEIVMDDALSMMEGVTVGQYAQALKFHVGIKELCEFPNARLPLGKAMVPIVGVFHEVCGHGGQVAHEYGKETNLSSVLALNYYACKGSAYYYGLGDNVPTYQYYHQPCEIAAEYMGIKCAYMFLRHEYGKDIATEMIKAYDQYRYDTKSGCIARGPKFDSVEGLLTEFDSEFKKCVFSHRMYNSHTSEYDSLWNYSMRVRNKMCGKIVEGCQNGLKQDWVMASVFVYETDYSNYIKERPSLIRIDLDPVVALRFGAKPIKPKPVKRRMYLDELSDVANELNRRLENDDNGLSL